MNNSIFIISFYNSRTPKLLEGLINDLIHFNQTIAVIANIDDFNKVEMEKHNDIYFLKRPNIGMNIGAWNEGWKFFNDFENYFFFQDECFVKDKNFYEVYLDLLSNNSHGIIGESINLKWCKSWDEIKKLPINYKITNKDKQTNRVDFYLKKMHEWGIECGTSGKHLRALNWALSQNTLAKIKGFPLGQNKEECIASEISVSRDIEAKKLGVFQSSNAHFKYIGHQEWGSEGFSKK